MSAPRWARHVREKVNDAEQWIRASAFGAVDGLTTNAGFVFGTALAGSSPHEILIAGIHGLVAAPLAQAVGEYTSVSVENEAKRSKAERDAGSVAPRLNSPLTAAVAAWGAAFTGAAAPVVPYLAGQSSPLWAVGVGAAGLAAAGIASTKVTGRRWWQGASRFLAAGGVAGALSYLGDNPAALVRHPVLTAATVAGAVSAAVVGRRWRRHRAARAARAKGDGRRNHTDRRRRPTIRLRGGGSRQPVHGLRLARNRATARRDGPEPPTR